MGYISCIKVGTQHDKNIHVLPPNKESLMECVMFSLFFLLLFSVSLVCFLLLASKMSITL